MEQKGLRVIPANKTFFTKLTNTISKLWIPTKVGFNSMIISIKRNNVLKAYENYNAEKKKEIDTKSEIFEKKYEETYTLYLESIDKYIMDSIYKKVKNDNASEFERVALSNYYEVTKLKANEYVEYKYKKQKYLLELDYQSAKETEKEKLVNRYEIFYCEKMDAIYKGLLKHYSVQLADNITPRDKEKIYDKIFASLEDYIGNILPIKLKQDKENTYQEIVKEYEKFESYTVGKLEQKEYIEKKILLLGISRSLFTHSLPLVVAEQCYIKLLKDTRSLIIDTRVKKKQEAAYGMLLDLIEDYNIRLLSTKIYWDKPKDREEYKKFWDNYKALQKVKENGEEYAEKREILFIKNDLIQLNRSKRDYSKIIRFYKKRLVALGAMKELKNNYCSKGNYTKMKSREKAKEIV